MLAGAVCAPALVAVSNPAVARVASTDGIVSHPVRCNVPGEWPHTRDGAWLWHRLKAAGYRKVGCTGSAFVIDYGGTGRRGHDLYIWALKTPHLAS